MTKPPTPVEPKRKRRWFQYSLRTFLLLITGLAIWFGWLTNEVRQQRAAVAWVEDMGGTVDYDYEFVSNFSNADVEPPGPKWLRETLGIDFMADVAGVGLYGTRASDVTPLANLTNLRGLNLVDTRVSDLTPLAELKNLRWLYLGRLDVSEEQVIKLRRALPNCDIDWYPPKVSKFR